ncbi:retrovirus-related pol polyprotein from transposon TNT 1-94 [Tanacetum coccineum]
MAFVSSPSSTNEVNTAYRVSAANTQVSPASTQVNTASTQVNTASTQVNTANLSDDTVYAFLASQPNVSQLVYEDLEQIHEDDIEEMDLKWQLALLSMRTRSDLSYSGLEEFQQPDLKAMDLRLVLYISKEDQKAMLRVVDQGNDMEHVLISQTLGIRDEGLLPLGEETKEENYYFITELENLVDKKVKIIRCDNGTEFKNRVMSEFYEKKGIKKEFSVARTSQQNCSYDFCDVTESGIVDFTAHNKTYLYCLEALVMESQMKDSCWILMNSKAFRVYNIRTRKVEENLHIRFLKDKPIIAGDGPKWLFDFDALTKSMNYVPVVEGTNSNDFVGTEESIGAGHSSKETGSSQDYIFMPLWKDGSLFDSSSKNANNDEPQPPSDAGKKDDEGVCKESGIDDQERPKNSTQDINNARPKVDMSNITTTYPVPSTLNTRIYKDHSLDHVIGDVQSSVQTRRMTKTTNKGKTHEDLHTCLFACFLSQVYRNKKDERGIVVRNKARLVTQGYTQEEGIDYDEVFAPVARIEAIRLFLAYASFMNFIVYQMDVKTAFLYGKIEEEVYVCQPLGFEDPKFPDRVYKVEKALYGLHQAPRAWKMGFLLAKKYVDEILKKFGFSTMKAASTPMETSKPLLKDTEAEDVDVHLYRSMIGSMMYLTVSRPDIMFVVCACAKFQDTPKVSHLHDVKRIFRYLKGQPKLGLWYPKDSPFDLEAYSDSDYAGTSLDRKSTIGGCQFLRSRLISWQCKKRTIVANSTTEA